MVIVLEPAESLRVMSDYRKPDILVLSNTRPVYPVDVISGAMEYPEIDDFKKVIIDHAGDARFINATELTLKVKIPILENFILMAHFSNGECYHWNVKNLTPQ